MSVYSEEIRLADVYRLCLADVERADEHSHFYEDLLDELGMARCALLTYLMREAA